MAKIAVLVKAALDPNLMKVDQAGSVMVEQTQMVISEYDRNAVQAALDLRDKLGGGGGGQVIALSVFSWGSAEGRRKDYEGVLREALAMGVDEAHAVADDSLASGTPLATSEAIAALAKALGGFDVYVAGEGSSDMVSGQVAPRLSALLNIPAVTYVKKVEVDGQSLRLTRDLEDALETVRVPLPAVISVTGESNKPKLPTLIQIRRAFSKQVKYYSAHDLGVSRSGAVEQSSLRALVQKRKNVYIDGSKPDEAAAAFLQRLAEEGILVQR